MATVIESFRQRGLKITPQRRSIFLALANSNGHPTAEEIYQHTVSVLPDTSRTTVYNTLHELVALGELAEIDLGDGRTRYDTDSSSHHHLHCLDCHTLVDIHREVGPLTLLPEEAAGFRIVGRRVTFDGYCRNCQAD